MRAGELFIDAHTHIMSPKRLRGGVRWLRKYYPPSREYIQEKITGEQALEELRTTGVDCFFNYFYPLHPGECREIHAWQAELTKLDTRVIPFGSLDPGDEGKKGIISEALDTLGFVGFKFHPYIQRFSVLDKRMEAVWTELASRRGLVAFHTGYASWYQEKPAAAEIRELMCKYPEMTVIAAHMFHLEVSLEDLADWLAEFPNLYLDVTNVLATTARAEWPPIITFVREHSERILYGSDYPIGAYAMPDVYDLIKEACPGPSYSDLAWRTAGKLLRRFGPDHLDRLNTGEPV